MTIFSKIIAREIPSYKVAEDEKHYAFLDINPIGKGHTLVVPKKEVDYIFDLSDNEIAELVVFAKKTAKAISKVFPNSLRVGMAVIGLDVPHAHIHLVPLYSTDDLNFKKEKLKLSKEEFEEIAHEISGNF